MAPSPKSVQEVLQSVDYNVWFKDLDIPLHHQIMCDALLQSYFEPTAKIFEWSEEMDGEQADEPYPLSELVGEVDCTKVPLPDSSTYLVIETYFDHEIRMVGMGLGHPHSSPSMYYWYSLKHPTPESRIEPDESMDGDHASALASAGFGTDEDYEH